MGTGRHRNRPHGGEQEGETDPLTRGLGREGGRVLPVLKSGLETWNVNNQWAHLRESGETESQPLEGQHNHPRRQDPSSSLKGP